MNIFVTDKCPKKSAKSLDDKRVVKMCLETAQLLSTALHKNNYHGDDVYKATHANHPCTIWAAKTRLNYLWLLEHLQALCGEYTARYGKEHKCSTMIPTFLKHARIIPSGALLPFVNCAQNKSLGISYKDEYNVVTAYKLYLADRWESDKRTPTWYGVKC